MATERFRQLGDGHRGAGGGDLFEEPSPQHEVAAPEAGRGVTTVPGDAPRAQFWEPVPERDVIQSAVRTVKAAAIITGDSGLGRWQALQLRVFMSRCVEQGIPLIPVLLPGVEAIPNNLEFLRELNQVKFGKDVIEKEGLSRLIWGITGEKA